jgi:hypothetical protein
MLEEVLSSDQPVNLDEPSDLPIPYTPLFIAYINDHFQVLYLEIILFKMLVIGIASSMCR